MKNFLNGILNRFSFFHVAFLLLFYSFTLAYEVQNSTAEVNQEEGLYIFYRSKPVAEYEYLGTYKIKLVWDDNPDLLFNKLVRKTKEKYPHAQAIIVSNGMGQADAIRFKKP